MQRFQRLELTPAPFNQSILSVLGVELTTGKLFDVTLTEESNVLAVKLRQPLL